MAKRLAFTGKREVTLESYDPPPAGEGEVELRTRVSLMSTGTETIVFDRLFEPGGHWDEWVAYPFHPGYAAIGEVTRVGAGVEALAAGDRVAVREAHASHLIAPADRCYPLPPDMTDRDASWFALAKIAFMSVKAAPFHLGASVLIIGAGPIGQMTTRWARAAGAETIIVADRLADRLALAKRGGATATIAKDVAEARDDVLAANGGREPDIVVDGTGHPDVFAAALGLAKRFGRVVVLGDTGSPTQQHLTGDVVLKGLTVVGTHDPHAEGEWNEGRIVHLFFALAASGRFDVADLITHEFAPADCEKAYTLATDRRGETMGILFDWTED
jgi:2-desacetyl-2-hydroxyethyl bacteriochlorophyllide A dehydrogenase